MDRPPTDEQATDPHTDRLDPAFGARWVAALRSGGYIQGRLRLRWRNDTFCCLGVAADLLQRDGETEGWVIGGTGDAYEIERHRCDLPKALADRIGLGWERHDVLAALNDDGSTFDDIADVIARWMEEDAAS